MLHGDAVGWGMRFAHRLARRRGADGAFLDRVERLLDRLELPALPALEATELLPLLARDKKAREGGLTWVLPVAPGRGERVGDLPPALVESELAAFLAERRPAGPY
jgi:3-dehydroquinate synthetase